MTKRRKAKNPKVYTIGSDKLTPARLSEIVTGLFIVTLIDCRAVPSSRPTGVSRVKLQGAFKDMYRWEGERLGIHASGPKAIRWLSKFASSAPGNTLLLCKEEAPGNCHRHFKIALSLLQDGIDCRHIFEDHIVLASELERAIKEDDGYEYENLP